MSLLFFSCLLSVSFVWRSRTPPLGTNTETRGRQKGKTYKHYDYIFRSVNLTHCSLQALIQCWEPVKHSYSKSLKPVQPNNYLQMNTLIFSHICKWKTHTVNPCLGIEIWYQMTGRFSLFSCTEPVRLLPWKYGSSVPSSTQDTLVNNTCSSHVIILFLT